MRGWFPIFREVEIGRLVENSMLVKKASEQTIVTLQSLHHGSVGYHLVHTRVGLTKKACPCMFNQEHKQGYERM
jgi:hypothetical protein